MTDKENRPLYFVITDKVRIVFYIWLVMLTLLTVITVLQSFAHYFDLRVVTVEYLFPVDNWVLFPDGNFILFKKWVGCLPWSICN